MTSTKRALTALATGALALPFIYAPAAYAVAPEPPAVQDVSEFCSTIPASFDPFTDDEPNTFTDEIECVAFAGIALGGPRGLPQNQYGPAFAVQRDQMASFIARMIDAADNLDTGDNIEALPDAGANQFTDVPSSNTHVANINRLAAADIARGGPGGAPANTYGPTQLVTRAQMASFINRAIAYMLGEDPNAAGVTTGLTSTNDYFTDDEAFANNHEPNINGIASAGIAVGDGRDTYRPTQFIQRDQMAGFLARTLAELFDEGLITEVTEDAATTPPAQSGQVALTSSSVQQGGAVTGTITGENIQSVSVSGCGLNNATVGSDSDAATPGRQFSINLPESQAPGNCVLTFTITTTNGQTTTETENVTVTARPGQGTATVRPELVSASVVQTTAQGTTVRYTFDEALTGTNVVPGNFHVYQFGFTNSAGGDAGQVGEQGDTAQVDNANTRSVLVTFTGITTATAASNLSLATVDFGAVRGLEGTPADANPEGDAPLNPGTTSQLGAGQTAGPDLTAVQNFRANPANVNESLVDFVFDEAAFNNVAGGYRLVDVDGVTEYAGTIVAGDGTATHTVAFANNGGVGAPSTVALTAADIARGTINTGTVDDVSGAGGNVNPLQADEVTGTGISETPDLETAEIRRDVTISAGVVRDQILYTFDEPVLVNTVFAGNAPDTAFAEATVENLFRAYLSDGTEVFGSAADATATRSTTNDRQVLVTFGQDQLDLAVGASVSDGAVTEGAGGQTRPNQQDEVGISNVGTGPTTTAGRTAAPDLVAVAIERITNAFGTVTGARVRYTFDEDVVVVNEQDLYAYQADGTRFQCQQAALVGGPGAAAVAGTTEETDNQVTCEQFQEISTVFTGEATTTDILSFVLGTVDDGAVADQAPNSGPGTGTPAGTAGTDVNPEGAALATGGTGTPAS